MKVLKIFIIVYVLFFAALFSVLADSSYYPDTSDPYMGQYEGQRYLDDGTVELIFGQVFPIGGGHYEARLRPTMSTSQSRHVVLQGKEGAGHLEFTPTIGEGGGEVLQITQLGVLIAASQWHAEINGDELAGWLGGQENGHFRLKKEKIESNTLGAKPPEDAIVLYDGSGFKEWKHKDSDSVEWKLVDGAMEVVPKTANLVSKETFGDHRLHLEFRTPLMPQARGQDRGNSGVYLHGRYEVQVLDSFGLEGEWNECGGIYNVARPAINMCAPPTEWQTYDITFRAPRFDEDGNKTQNAEITVLHNGIKIHDKIELPEYTGGPIKKNEMAKGPLMLQEHKNPVQYRNIWIVEE